MKSFLKGSAIALALTAGAVAVPAHAVPFVGGSLVISALTDTTTDLATAMSFNLNPASYTLENGTQDFAGIAPTVISDSSFNVNLSSFNFSDPALGSFTATGVTDHTFNSTTHAASFIVLGNYTAGTDFSNAGSVFTADEAFSLTQVGGPGTGVSISATFFSPQVVPGGGGSSVPEPVTISIFGAGLMAIGWARRRRT